jgi:hypothetical protein
MQVEQIKSCPVCHSSGQLWIEGSSDLAFGVPGLWDYARCVNVSCGCLFLVNRPKPDEVTKLYKSYYTHTQPLLKRHITGSPLGVFYEKLKLSWFRQAYG